MAVVPLKCEGQLQHKRWNYLLRLANLHSVDLCIISFWSIESTIFIPLYSTRRPNRHSRDLHLFIAICHSNWPEHFFFPMLSRPNRQVRPVMLWISMYAEVVYIRPHQEQYFVSEEFGRQCLFFSYFENQKSEKARKSVRNQLKSVFFVSKISFTILSKLANYILGYFENIALIQRWLQNYRRQHISRLTNNYLLAILGCS